MKYLFLVLKEFINFLQYIWWFKIFFYIFEKIQDYYH